MKKFVNDPKSYVPEMLEGVALANPGTLKMTKAKFYRASGASTQKKGVMSDIVLPSKWNYAKDLGELAGVILQLLDLFRREVRYLLVRKLIYFHLPYLHFLTQ